MKVKELIEKLSKFDLELEVMKLSDYSGNIIAIEEIILNRCHDDLPNINVVLIK